jgi:hypothetical protein
MASDPIIEEIHRIREAYAARFNYDLRAIYQDLKKREEQGEFVVVSRSPRPSQEEVRPKKRLAERGAA